MPLRLLKSQGQLESRVLESVRLMIGKAEADILLSINESWLASQKEAVDDQILLGNEMK